MAPKPKHERLIQGSWDRLSAEQKKNAVKLNSDYYIVYPLDLSPESFKMKAKYADKSESELKNLRNQARVQLKSELVNDDFKEKNLNTSKLLLNGSSVLEKDWRLFKFASPEMQWVKKSLAALNNVLEEGVADYINEKGIFDSDKYQERVNKAYDEFFLAAQNYLDNRNPSSIAGKRRRRRVDELLINAKKSKLDFNAMIEHSKDGIFKFENMSQEKRQQVNAYNLITEIPSQVATEVQWQNQGNSTDVYRVSLVGEDGKHYYLKENLPFLNENMAGFLTRRSRQLNISRNNMPGKPNADTGLVEERIKDIGEKDYDNALTLINNLNNSINNASEADKFDLGEKYAKYFAYNFDDLFKSLEMNNSLADKPELLNTKTLDEMIQDAKDNGDKFLEQGLRLQKMKLEVEGVPNPGGQKPEPFVKMTAYEYMKKVMNLDDNKDKLFLDSIKGLSDKEMETLFRVTMGKEVELFGQMSAQGMQKGDDKAAINNTATSRVAEHLGFDDVITKSHTSLVKFTRRDKTQVNQLCTVCEEAVGTEFIDLMKMAEKDGVKIIYSPEAIRNLMRLQAIDTLCLQKDRHGRNFKCDIDRDPKTNNIIIKSLKAYDNDMSFDAIDLKTAFNEASGDPKRVQFLPSMTMKIKKGSALYKHVLGNYFGVDVVSPLKIPASPQIDIGRTSFDLSKALTSGPRALMEGKMQIRTDYDAMSHLDDMKINPKMSKESKAKYIKEMEQLGIKYDPKEELDCFRKYASIKIANYVDELKKTWYLDKNAREAVNQKYMQEHEGKKRPHADLPYNLDMNDDQKAEVEKLINEMKQFSSDFDFSHTYHFQYSRTMGSVPLLDMLFKTVTYAYDSLYGDSIDKRFFNELKGERYEAAKQLMDEQGNFVVPTLLHYDNEAYLKLKQAVNDYNDPNSLAVNNLKKLGLSQDKIDAIVTRDREMLAHLEIAQQKALLFYKAAGWSGSPKTKFFLDKQDYKELGNLTDFAIDPGNTYLAIDNENYLTGQKFMMKDGDKVREVSYTELMNDMEKQQAKDYNKYIQDDKKRWKYKDEEKNDKKYDVANTDTTLITEIDAKYYIHACQADAIYSASHDEIKSAEELVGKFKDILFTQRIPTNKPLELKKIKEYMKPDSNLRAAFENDLKSPSGKMFMKNLKESLAKEYTNGSYKNLTAKNVETFKQKIFEKSLNDIFAKFNEPGIDKNAAVEGILDQCKDMKDFAKNFGVKLDPEKVLDEFIEKNPNVLTQEQIKQIKKQMNPEKVQKAVQNAAPGMN